jgi:hypothetical protein
MAQSLYCCSYKEENKSYASKSYANEFDYTQMMAEKIKAGQFDQLLFMRY